MSDLPDPNSPYLILRQNDSNDHFDRASVDIKTNKVKSGNPIIIPWEPASYGQPTDMPLDKKEKPGDTDEVIQALQH